MARFSEEEVATLNILVDWEIREVIDAGAFSSEDIYIPYLHNLKQKLENYHNKHYPEDKTDGEDLKNDA